MSVNRPRRSSRGRNVGKALGLTGHRDLLVKNVTLGNGTAGPGGGLWIDPLNQDSTQDFDIRVSDVMITTSNA